MSCFVKKCKNNKRLLSINSRITFHKFPKNETVFKEWLKSLGVYDKNIVHKPHMFLCSEHFHPNDFVVVGKRRFLKANALPILPLEFSENSTKNKDSDTTTLKVHDNLFLMPFYQNSFTAELDPLMDVEDPLLTTNAKVTEALSTDYSSKLDDLTSRITLEHSYTVSPLVDAKQVAILKGKLDEERQKGYRSKQTIKKLKRKVEYLKEVVKDMESKYSDLERYVGSIS